MRRGSGQTQRRLSAFHEEGITGRIERYGKRRSAHAAGQDLPGYDREAPSEASTEAVALRGSGRVTPGAAAPGAGGGGFEAAGSTFGAGQAPYLAAKSVVDARAVNREVRQAAAAALRRIARERGGRTPLRVLEVGAGAGHALPRWLELLAPFPSVEFTATDPSDALLDRHREAAAAWAREHRRRLAEGGARELRIEADGRNLVFRFERAAAPGGLDRFPSGAFDLLAAQSVWDLTPPGSALAVGRRLLRPGGLFYSVLTFCGETSFEPPLPLDESVLDRYHRSIEARGGDPGAGTRLAAEMERGAGADFTVLASGRADWRVPAEGGRTSDAERVFLSAVLDFIEKEVAGDPEVPEAADWLAARRRALAAGRLRYRAANRDLAAARR